MNTDLMVGELLRSARQKSGWSQGELAKQSGISQSTIWRIENGLIAEPKIGIMLKLAEALMLDIHQLISQRSLASSVELGQVEVSTENEEHRINLAYELCRTDPQFALGLRVTGEPSIEFKRWIIQLYEAATKRRLL